MLFLSINEITPSVTATVRLPVIKIAVKAPITCTYYGYEVYI